MQHPPELAALLLLLFQLSFPLFPLIHAVTATATVVGQADPVPLEGDHPQPQQPQAQRKSEISTSSATTSQCEDHHEVSICRTEEKSHHSADEGDGDVAAKGTDQEKYAAADERDPTTTTPSATKGQRKSDTASSSHLFPSMKKTQTPERTATEDDDGYENMYEDGGSDHEDVYEDNDYEYVDGDEDYMYVNDAYAHEHNENEEQLRKKVALEQMSEGGKQPTLEQMKYSRGCHRQPKGGRPLYTEEDWQRLRQIYKDQGGGTIRDQAEPPGDFVPPMRSGQTSDGKGRGLFAARDIKRGEKTYGGIKNIAFFVDAPSYRRFLEALSAYEACDVIMWTWIQDTQWQKVILLVLDDNALQNSGAGDEANTGQHPDGIDSAGIFDEFALRDIQEGEELLCDYDLFIDNFWNDFGL